MNINEEEIFSTKGIERIGVFVWNMNMIFPCWEEKSKKYVELKKIGVLKWDFQDIQKVQNWTTGFVSKLMKSWNAAVFLGSSKKKLESIFLQ